MNQETVNSKDLKDTAADPEGSLIMTIYNTRTHKQREQSFKRKKLMRKAVNFTGIDGRRYEGIIIAFSQENGEPFVYSSAGVKPAKEADLVVMER